MARETVSPPVEYTRKFIESRQQIRAPLTQLSKAVNTAIASERKDVVIGKNVKRIDGADLFERRRFNEYAITKELAMDVVFGVNPEKSKASLRRYNTRLRAGQRVPFVMDVLEGATRRPAGAGTDGSFAQQVRQMISVATVFAPDQWSTYSTEIYRRFERAKERIDGSAMQEVFASICRSISTDTDRGYGALRDVTCFFIAIGDGRDQHPNGSVGAVYDAVNQVIHSGYDALSNDLVLFAWESAQAAVGDCSAYAPMMAEAISARLTGNIDMELQVRAHKDQTAYRHEFLEQ